MTSELLLSIRGSTAVELTVDISFSFIILLTHQDISN